MMSRLQLITMLICLIYLRFSISSTIQSKFKENQLPSEFPTKITFKRMGYYPLSDIGAFSDTTWACSSKGEILKWSKDKISLLISNPKLFSEKCKRIESDSKGQPWVITESKKLYQLAQVHADSYVWRLMSDCAVDIGCGNLSCFIIECDNKTISKWNGFKWSRYCSKSNLVSLDLGEGISREVPYVVDKQGKIFKYDQGLFQEIPLDAKVLDVSVSKWNDLYIAHDDGVTMLRRGNPQKKNLFPGIVQRISAGNRLWVVSKDTLTYRTNEDLIGTS